MAPYWVFAGATHPLAPDEDDPEAGDPDDDDPDDDVVGATQVAAAGAEAVALSPDDAVAGAVRWTGRAVLTGALLYPGTMFWFANIQRP